MNVDAYSAWLESSLIYTFNLTGIMSSIPLLFLVGIFCQSSVRGQEIINDEAQAIEWLEEYNQMAMGVYYETTVASWTYQTDITDANEQAAVRCHTTVHSTRDTILYCHHLKA